MKKRKLLASIALASILLTACGQKASDNLNRFKNDDGHYAYPGLEWGMTTEDIAKVTDWEIAEPQDLFNPENGEFIYSMTTVPNVEFAGEIWETDLQFDENGGLWCVTLNRKDDIKKVEKLFEEFDAEMNNIYGEPTAAYYDKTNEVSHFVTHQSALRWSVFNEDGLVINSLSLNYLYLEGDQEASIVLGTKWNEEGFATE